jgi:hypothetical protein
MYVLSGGFMLNDGRKQLQVHHDPTDQFRRSFCIRTKAD